VNQRVEAVSREITIINKHGLHARPVMQFVDLASRFDSSIALAKGSTVVDGKSPMEIMLLEGVCGTRLTLTAKGPDAEEAVTALSDLVARGFQVK